MEDAVAEAEVGLGYDVPVGSTRARFGPVAALNTNWQRLVRFDSGAEDVQWQARMPLALRVGVATMASLRGVGVHLHALAVVPIWRPDRESRFSERYQPLSFVAGATTYGSLAHLGLPLGAMVSGLWQIWPGQSYSENRGHLEAWLFWRASRFDLGVVARSQELHYAAELAGEWREGRLGLRIQW